ncbi:uncharacterized protein K02A2.6-like [Armigeres subalbatus]|uniref:uncharacterized protein K02A2.6-like n=1 Tax=Armigeres subalbatus TaxID=124917 RepID=UPI002ED621C3
MLSEGDRMFNVVYDNVSPALFVPQLEEVYPEPVRVPFKPKEIPEYDNAVLRLNKFFIGKRNVRIELELFRTLKQASSEPFSQFLLRLRTQAIRCDFQEREEIEILQQVTMGAFDERVRDKGLEGTLDLDGITNYAMNREMLLKQKEKAKALAGESAVVASVKQEWRSAATREFFVIDGANKSLLSKTTAEELNVLKVGLDVHQVEESVAPFPKFPNVQVKLSVDLSVPPKKIAYLRIPEPLKHKVDEKIQDMLRQDIIEPVRGAPDWISPLVVVPKGRGDIRLCVNMKLPNEAIQREHFPIPVIDSFLNELRGATYFSKLDMTSAYYHLELHPDSRNVTTFMTNRGLMRFKRLMFGINCAPEIFQRVMTEMFSGINGVVVYIDDVVVAGSTREEHDLRLQQVLAVLKSNNAKLNLEKCVFGVTELNILGFKVSALGICPSEEKVAAIRDFRMPETKEEVRSFLGLVNFVGHFIPHLSTRTEPLREFIRGEVETFGKTQQAAFNDLRQELTTKVRKLGFFDPKDSTELFVDASPVGLGAVLIQRDDAGWPRIISFASKGLTDAERMYPQTQREALAVVWAVEKYYLYLYGLHFTIFTDHKTLEYIFEGKYRDGKRACSRAQGWALRLQPYDFQIKHIEGTKNISDVLSRLCTKEDAPFDENTQHFLCAIGESPAAITLEEIRNETLHDSTLSGVIEALRTQIWPTELFRYQAFDKELGLIRGILVREDRIVLPLKLRQRALEIAHRGHPGIVAMRRNLRQYVWWPCMDTEVCSAVKQCVGCTAVSNQDPPEPMCRKAMPERPWQEIAIDFLSAKEFATFLVVVDYYSRYLHVVEMKSTTASKTVEALEKIFKDHTYPESIRSDNGPPFTSEEFSYFCASKNINLVKSIPYWPQMNGLIERQNRGILKSLRISKALKSDWRKNLEEYVYIYNTTPHSVTEKAPLELLTGRPVKDLLPSLRTDPYFSRDEHTKENDAIKKMQGKLYADRRRNAKESEIAIGDIVMMRSYESGKLEPNFKMEKFTVLDRSGSDTTIVNKDGVKYRRPVAHLKKWPSTAITSNPSDSFTDLQEPLQEQCSQPGLQDGAISDSSSHPRKLAKPADVDSTPKQKRPMRIRKIPKRFT